MAQQPLVRQDSIMVEASISHSDTPHSVGLLWTTDQPDAETSTWQHTTLNNRQTSMPHAGFEPVIPASCVRLTPQTAGPRGWAFRKALRGKTTKCEVYTPVMFSISLFQLWQNSLRHIKLSSLSKRPISPSIIFLHVRKTCMNLSHYFLELDMGWTLNLTSGGVRQTCLSSGWLSGCKMTCRLCTTYPKWRMEETDPLLFWTPLHSVHSSGHMEVFKTNKLFKCFPYLYK